MTKEKRSYLNGPLFLLSTYILRGLYTIHMELVSIVGSAFIIGLTGALSPGPLLVLTIREATRLEASLVSWLVQDMHWLI